ncbi:MAG: serine/threonine protein kinase [Muribaculaceae bacterium]|nr:serine/threonine protein kinase [Muribaculaceae bacterium]
MKDINSIASSGELLDGRYKLLRPLSSEGGSADVWLALDTNTIDEVFDEDSLQSAPNEETGIQVAIKVYRPKNALDLGEQRFREEFKIVFNCHHENLVQPINFSIYQGIPYLVMPYSKNGSSESLQGKLTDKDQLWKYIEDVSAGLAYLHAFSPTIVHHDIKPANILIDDHDNFAITDFGISSQRGINRDGYDYYKSGTMAYMAPERFNEDYESIPESDIWSLGATLYELVTGKVPFGEEGGEAQTVAGGGCPPIEPPIPKDLKNLINDCLALDPAKRPSAATIHKAAQTRHYPPRNKGLQYFIWGLALAAAIIGVIFISLPSRQAGEGVEEIPDDIRFQYAMALVNAPDAETLSLGMLMLDSLVNKGYVPAIYEEAYTYGWYADSASLERKKLLGIKLSPENPLFVNEKWLPAEESVNRKAISLLTMIDEANDPDYPEINAKALNTLAAYYFNTDKVFSTNYERALQLSEKALNWAVKSRDMPLIQKISNNVEFIKSTINDN